MEILQNSLTESDISELNLFQSEVWEIFNLELQNLVFDKLSPESSIEKGLGIDVFLKLKESDFLIYLSLTKNCFKINSIYFDFYLYPEIELDKISLLLKELLAGRYFVKLKFDEKDKLCAQELSFDNKGLQEYNEDNKIGFFSRESQYEEIIEGYAF